MSFPENENPTVSAAVEFSNTQCELVKIMFSRYILFIPPPLPGIYKFASYIFEPTYGKEKMTIPKSLCGLPMARGLHFGHL